MNALSWLFVFGFFVLSLGAAIVTTVVRWVKRRRFPLLYGLLIVTVLLSCFQSFYLFQPIKPVGFGLQVEETDVADLAIHTMVIVPADTDQPVQVLVTLSRLEQSPMSSGSPSQPAVQPTPVGTPGEPIVKAFGSDYDLFARAQLSARAFDVAPQEQPERSLDQPGTFAWTLTPKEAGHQSVEVLVTGRWIPKKGGSVIERLLANQSFSVDVATPPSPIFSFQLFVVLSSVLLSVPWIAELLKKRQETKKVKSDTPLSTAPCDPHPKF